MALRVYLLFTRSLCCPNWDSGICDSHHVLEPLPLNQSLSLGAPEQRFWSNNNIPPNSDNRGTKTPRNPIRRHPHSDWSMQCLLLTQADIYSPRALDLDGQSNNPAD